jgi:cell wall-associated NlpC family hydrolase
LNKRVSENQIREKIVNTGKLFLGVPYLWGGRSMYIPELQFGVHSKPETRNQKLQSVATGVDCSGLTNLVYRVNNIDIPRDAHEQWMKSEHITPEELKAGDLLFASTEGNIHSINHVMLYIGGEQFIEVSETGSFVRFNTLREKFGIGISKLAQHHFLVDNKKIYFGRVIDAGF